MQIQLQNGDDGEILRAVIDGYVHRGEENLSPREYQFLQLAIASYEEWEVTYGYDGDRHDQPRNNSSIW